MPFPPDLTQRFLLENLDIRGQVVQLGPVWTGILARRAYDESLRQLLGEFASIAVLIAAGMKHPGRAVLQVTGPGPVAMAVADCTHELALRAMLRSAPGSPPTPGRGAEAGERTIRDCFPNGRLVLTLENASTARQFQSLVLLEGTSLAESFERYFDRSEQVPTHLWVHATDEGVGALILQKLPGTDERDPSGWARVQQHAARNALDLLGGTTRGKGGASPRSSGKEAGGEGIAALLSALFPEDDVRLFRPQGVSDGCTRSGEKVIAMLRGLGRAEVEATLAEHGLVTVHDEICNQEYRFSASDVARMFSD